MKKIIIINIIIFKYIKEETGDEIRRVIKEKIEWGNTGIRPEENKGLGKTIANGALNVHSSWYMTNLWLVLAGLVVVVAVRLFCPSSTVG